MRHDEKYLLISNAFAGKQRLMPFFNRSNIEDLILAIQSAYVSNGRNGLLPCGCATSWSARIRVEKLAESEEYLHEHRTDGTDAFDTLYIGCEKFRSTILSRCQQVVFSEIFAKFAKNMICFLVMNQSPHF